MGQCVVCKEEAVEVSQCRGCKRDVCPDCCVSMTQMNMIDFPFCKACDDNSKWMSGR